MDTKVGPIGGLFRPRETEGADTRYGLIHQDFDGYGRGRKRRQESSVDGLSEDEATVSIEALLLFLESFLERRFGLSTEENGLEKIPETHGQRAAANIEALRLKASQAVQAYKHAAHVTHKVAKQKARTLEAGEPKDEDSRERDLVIGLIRDLRILVEQDVPSLKIERGGGFVESMAAAVLRAKEDLSS